MTNWINVDELALEVNISSQRLRAMARDGEITARKDGKYWMFPTTVIDDLLGIDISDCEAECAGCGVMKSVTFFRSKYFCRECLCADRYKHDYRQSFSILALAREV